MVGNRDHQPPLQEIQASSLWCRKKTLLYDWSIGYCNVSYPIINFLLDLDKKTLTLIVDKIHSICFLTGLLNLVTHSSMDKTARDTELPQVATKSVLAQVTTFT